VGRQLPGSGTTNFHCKENLLKDVDNGLVGMLMVDGTCVGTGCYRDTHITRVYVLPECQGQGYGSYIMDRLEEIIAKDHDKALLDASLPASHLYEKRGYVTTEHCKYPVENGELDFYYEHLNVNDEIRAGKCHSVPQLNCDGKIELHEEWKWLNGDCSTGSSIVVEV